MAPTPAPLAWQLLTRLGELQILLPAMLVAAWTIRRDAPRLAGRWLVAIGAAIGLTTASKIAFIGYGWGVPALDFTGVSGHTMMSASVLPMLLQLATPAAPGRARYAGFAAGAILALAVAASRLQLHTHSFSEVAAGVALGASVSALALAAGEAPRLRLPRVLAFGLVAAVLLAALAAPPARTHDAVTRLALALSGRPQPYTRGQMHRDQREAALQSAARD
jgi:membrane-associated phospholipid phosphatase